MCGSSQQAGGMCGASASPMNMSEKIAKDWPAVPGQVQPEQKPGGMATAGCPCCKNMAMMGGMKSDDPHKGMDMK
jgi:hypothetical protein